MTSSITSVEAFLREGKIRLVKNSALAFSVLLTVMEVQRYLVSGKLHPVAFPFITFIIISLFSCWYYSNVKRNLQIASNSTVTVFCLLFMGLSYIAGGLEAPMVILGSVIPLIAFVIAGNTAFIITTIVVTLYYILMFVITKTYGSFGLPNPVTEDMKVSLNAGYCIALTMITVWIGWFFRKINREILEHLKQHANIDYLTQIPNRRSIEQILEKEFKRSQRQHTWLSILMIDIDHFKNINDSYGHQAGDYCLSHVTTILEKIINRSCDSIGRYGGEEFICILPNTDVKGAHTVAEKMRKAIEENPFILENGQSIPLTVTIGVQADICKMETRLEKMVFKADNLLYQGKQDGRNRVISIQSDLTSVMPTASMT